MYEKDIILDPTQTMVKNKLGYSNIQVVALKTIYDFISRFAWCQAESPRFERKIYSLDEVKISGQDIPLKTREILDSVGTERINLFYSPHSYPTLFEDFCKKTMKECNGRLVVKHYAVAGLIEIHSEKDKKKEGLNKEYSHVEIVYEE